MFDNRPGGHDRLNPGCRIYQEIAKVAAQVRAQPPLRFGRMYFRQISGNGQDFGLPSGTAYTLAFSRVLYGSEVLFAYNVAGAPRDDRVVVDAELHGGGTKMKVLYRSGSGSTADVAVDTAADGTRSVHLPLAGHEVMLLA